MRRPSLNSTALLTSTKHVPGFIFGEQIYKRALRGNRRIAIVPIAANPFGSDEMGPQRTEFERYRYFFKGRYKGADIVPFFYSRNLKGRNVGLLDDMIRNFEVVVLAGDSYRHGLRRLRSLGSAFFRNPFHFERLITERGLPGMLTAGDGAAAGLLCHHVAGLAPNILVVTDYNLSSWKKNELRSLARNNPLCLTMGLPSNASLEVARGQFPHGTAYQYIEVSIDHSGDIPRDPQNVPTQAGLEPVICYKDGFTEWRLHDGDTIGRAILPPSAKEVGWGNKKRRFWHFRTWVESPSQGAIFNMFTRKSMRGTATDDGYLRVNSLEDILVKKYYAINTRSDNW